MSTFSRWFNEIDVLGLPIIEDINQIPIQISEGFGFFLKKDSPAIHLPNIMPL